MHIFSSIKHNNASIISCLLYLPLLKVATLPYIESQPTHLDSHVEILNFKNLALMVDLLIINQIHSSTYDFHQLLIQKIQNKYPSSITTVSQAH